MKSGCRIHGLMLDCGCGGGGDFLFSKELKDFKLRFAKWDRQFELRGD